MCAGSSQTQSLRTIASLEKAPPTRCGSVDPSACAPIDVDDRTAAGADGERSLQIVVPRETAGRTAQRCVARGGR
ncbi:hypothetical protein AQ477_09140 [Burkholderia thailandensis]|nr:hypothetical protein AQ477_09140 [Burkholderia thailandensis]KXF62401.1 hypothetical protein AQ476_14700 [Burkholderia thailandensis]PNE73443.1 hypothetical protein A8H37_15585 [Burkholderia thailandensis]